MGSLRRFNLRHILRQAGLSTFVETGTGKGDSLAWALQAGFADLHSVEQFAQLFESSRLRFATDTRVHLHSGNSLDFLNGIVAGNPGPALYFLDAHFLGGADLGIGGYAASAGREGSYPLLDELKILRGIDLSRSIVIIDDARMYFEGEFQAGQCPVFARRWHDRDSLNQWLAGFGSSHSSMVLMHDEGYLLLVPKSVPFDREDWLLIRPNDRSGPLVFLPNVPGVTSISIQRRLADSRFATRYFKGDGMDVGGGRDSLALFSELFPQIRNVFVYDRQHGDAQTLGNVADDSFDFLYSSHCLEHVLDPAIALANWIRVVKPGGHLVVNVPDEDLYEQGIWPSRFNSDHKHTFTVSKAKSWSPVSVNVLELLSPHIEAVEVISVAKIDHGYRYDSLPRTIDQTRTPLAECAIEFVLRKRA